MVFRTAVEHLGLTPGGWTTRRVGPRFDALEVAGLLARSRRHGVVFGL